MKESLEVHIINGCKIVYRNLDSLAECVERLTSEDVKKEIRRAIGEIALRIHEEIEDPIRKCFPELDENKGKL